MITIGLVQAPSVSDVPRNLETLRRFAMQAADAHCKAICFPECFLTGYVPAEASSRSLEQSSPVLRTVSDTAKEYSMDLLVGYMERCGGQFFITHSIFRPDGSCFSYRKTHLGRREQQYFSSGDQLEVFPLSCGIRAGFQLCVETHYPEITQTLALRGAQLIFAPHAVPRATGDRQTVWGRFIPARSYDNRVYFACCNQWDGERFGGGCLVTDPRGDIAAACFNDGEALLTCGVDRDLPASFRTLGDKRSLTFFPSLRRPELYE